VFRREAQGRRVDFFAVDLLVIDKPFGGYTDGLAWLEAELSSSEADYKIVFGHFAIWASPGHYGNNAELAARLAPLLQRHGVNLYLSGHEHHLEIQAARDGLVQAISGAGSQNRDVAPGPKSRFASGRLGFMWFSVGRQGIDVQVISRDGLVLFEGPLPGA
jgi:acid phosphatase